ncbi:efflux RND transporter periplasmic adaptor subunit [Nevskia ramosa]|uniref:efflux RND transporter periplasmic adaptor subunit n=1 Tax=Nevskia ramosa TaxID=64002 RepID=UPI0003B38BA2|nr:HlyD family efflux transporter periplasmic adaptor subunit [Nevskia ramosa]
MNLRRIAAISGVLLLSTVALAHDGEVHRDPADAAGTVPTAPVDRPQRLADGSLQISKPMQRLLKLRTERWSSTSLASVQTLVAEARPQPEFALDVVAPERGRLEAPDGGWLQPGQAVKTGDVLAWLRPQLTQQEIADRRAKIATLEQQLVIIDVNVERQQMQSDATVAAGGSAGGNIWIEKYLADRDAMRANRDLLAQSLSDRLPLRAAVSGRVLSVPISPGAIVEAGQPLLRLADPNAVQFVVVHQQAGLAGRIAAAHLANGQTLRLRGEEPLADGSGWRLRFDAPASASQLASGQIASLRVSLKPLPGTVAVPPGACVRSDEGGGIVWVHREAERYEARKLASCNGDGVPAATLALVDGDRIVTEGAALLSQYR